MRSTSHTIKRINSHSYQPAVEGAYAQASAILAMAVDPIFMVSPPLSMTGVPNTNSDEDEGNLVTSVWLTRLTELEHCGSRKRP